MLDDCQWLDPASIDLLESLLTDRDNAAMLVLMNYRTEDLTEVHPLTRLLNDVRENGGSLGISDIPIGNITQEEVHAFVRDLLWSEGDATLELAACIYSKTHGNVFFVARFLQVLEKEGLLYYCLGKMEWCWCLDRINIEMKSTENVVDLLTERIHKLPEQMQKNLGMVACLGSAGGIDFLRIVVDHFPCDDDQIRLTSSQFLQICEDEGLMIRCGDSMYAWVHDHILSVALDIIPADRSGSVCYQLGELFLKYLSVDEVHQNVFCVAKLLNEVKHEANSIQKRMIAELNLLAGQKAFEASAFQESTAFLDKGIELLPTEDKWVDYILSLDLYSSAAEAHFCIGNFDKVREHCDEILRQATSLIDKRRAYNTLIGSLNALGHCHKSRELCLEVLAKIGCYLPQRALGFHLLHDVMRVKVNSKKILQQIRDLPLITDETKSWTMSLLNHFVLVAREGAPELVSLVIFKSLWLTLKYGISEWAAPAFASLGMLMVGRGMLQHGKLFADEALAVLKRIDSPKRVEARTRFILYQFVLHWQISAKTCKKKLESAYRIGMASGDTECGSCAIYSYLELGEYFDDACN
jgi:predicted ATPase